MQVILSGQARHSSPTPVSGGVDGTAVGMSRDGRPVVAGGDQPLRIYHEYLSFIFRKPEAPSTHQQLEMGYRDYLQVGCHYSSSPARATPADHSITNSAFVCAVCLCW